MPNLTYNTTSNRITTSGFEYDVAGNQTRAKAEDGSWLKFEYDAANRIQIVKKDDGTYLQAFQYGSTNARLMDMDYNYGYVKIIASNGGTTLSEYTEFTSQQPSWTKSYTYLGDSQLSTITPNGSGGEITEYNHPDRLGTKLTTNQSAGTSYEQTTLPFGTALNAETSGSQSKRFTSYERSARTGLDYAINRTYDSKQGRFTQVDPIGMSAVSLGAPQTLNLYNYCGNDPVNHLDPDGLFFGKLFKWIGKIFKVFNKILKWVVVAIAVIAVAIAIIKSGGAALGFLKAILGPLGKFLGIKIIGPGVITNIAGASVGIKIGIGAKIATGLYGVGAVASKFVGNGKNKETPTQRRNRLIKSAVKSALWRIINKPLCKKFIQEEFNLDPETVLEYATVKYDSTIKVAENADIGRGVFGTIRLGDKWFDDPKIDGWVGTMNRTNTRTLLLLHGLKHLVGTPHDTLPNGTKRDDQYYYKGIANNCFGLNLK